MTTINLRCTSFEPPTMEGYERDPRSVAKRAEAYLPPPVSPMRPISGPGPSSSCLTTCAGASACPAAWSKIDSQEAEWNSERVYEDSNIGHRPECQGGCLVRIGRLPATCVACHATRWNNGRSVEELHHRSVTASQCEIGTQFSTWCSVPTGCRSKYATWNVGILHRAVTFMPQADGR